jgi:hypothetical protein
MSKVIIIDGEPHLPEAAKEECDREAALRKFRTSHPFDQVY